MPKLLPFPAHRVRQTAETLVAASRATLSKPHVWPDRPDPAAIGNLLQRLIVLQPEAVLLVENVLADMVEILER
jgi:hypothetical protein